MRYFTPKYLKRKAARTRKKPICRTRHVKYVPYEEYLKSDHWRQTKEKSVEIYGAKCLICDSDNEMNHHHLFYPSHHNLIRAHQVVPLCRECHEYFHQNAPDGGKYGHLKQPGQVARKIRELFKCIGRRFISATGQRTIRPRRRVDQILKIFWGRETGTYRSIIQEQEQRRRCSHYIGSHLKSSGFVSR